jgi:hypothetical protein
MKNERALKGRERGRTFADKLMNAMSRVSTNIPRPKLWAGDRQEYYPLSVILMDREVEFVEENEKEDLPRGYDVGANKEVYQFSEANGESIGLQRGSGREMSLWIICACLLLRLFRALTS